MAYVSRFVLGGCHHLDFDPRRSRSRLVGPFRSLRASSTGRYKRAKRSAGTPMERSQYKRAPGAPPITTASTLTTIEMPHNRAMTRAFTRIRRALRTMTRSAPNEDARASKVASSIFPQRVHAPNARARSQSSLASSTTCPQWGHSTLRMISKLPVLRVQMLSAALILSLCSAPPAQRYTKAVLKCDTTYRGNATAAPEPCV